MDSIAIKNSPYMLITLKLFSDRQNNTSQANHLAC